MYETVRSQLPPGINRNIVECKVLSSVGSMTASPVLIETLWNVKIRASKLLQSNIAY